MTATSERIDVEPERRRLGAMTAGVHFGLSELTRLTRPCMA